MTVSNSKLKTVPMTSNNLFKKNCLSLIEQKQTLSSFSTEQSINLNTSHLILTHTDACNTVNSNTQPPRELCRHKVHIPIYKTLHLNIKHLDTHAISTQQFQCKHNCYLSPCNRCWVWNLSLQTFAAVDKSYWWNFSQVLTHLDSATIIWINFHRNAGIHFINFLIMILLLYQSPNWDAGIVYICETRMYRLLLVTQLHPNIS